jgi:hypothetical protein
MMLRMKFAAGEMAGAAVVAVSLLFLGALLTTESLFFKTFYSNRRGMKPAIVAASCHKKDEGYFFHKNSLFAADSI